MILPWSFMLCLCSAMPYVRISWWSKSYGVLLLSTRELRSYERWMVSLKLAF